MGCMGWQVQEGVEVVRAMDVVGIMRARGDVGATMQEGIGV